MAGTYAVDIGNVVTLDCMEMSLVPKILTSNLIRLVG